MVTAPTNVQRDTILLSHANPEDNEFTLWLALQLANEGYKVWCDLTKLLGGEVFWDDIEAVLRQSAVKVLYVLSRSSNAKDGPLRELHLALRKHSTGRYRSWIKRLRRLQQLSRIRVLPSRSFIEEGNYDSPPLPSLLVAFKERDAVTACFDEEGQYMLEGTSEPAVGVAFHPQNSEEVREVVRILERFVMFNHELFQLVEDLQEWEKSENCHADTRLDRGEPSLRAA